MSAEAASIARSLWAVQVARWNAMGYHGPAPWGAHLFAMYDAAPDRESAARALVRFDTHRDEGHPLGNARKSAREPAR